MQLLVSAALCPQLLGEYDSLVQEHEGLKVMDLLLELITFCSVIIIIISVVNYRICVFMSLCVSAEYLGVNREQAFRCQRSDIRTEEVSGLAEECNTALAGNYLWVLYNININSCSFQLSFPVLVNLINIKGVMKKHLFPLLCCTASTQLCVCGVTEVFSCFWYPVTAQPLQLSEGQILSGIF